MCFPATLTPTVCSFWEEKPPSNIVVNVGESLKVIPLKFGTFFGAWYKCNGFGHFARDCSLSPPLKQSKVTSQSDTAIPNPVEEKPCSSLNPPNPVEPILTEAPSTKPYVDDFVFTSCSGINLESLPLNHLLFRELFWPLSM